MLGISCDTQPSHRVFSNSLGNLPYPLVSDFHPKGEMSKAYGLWNADRGLSNRAVVIVDKEGIVRFRHEYTAPALPDPADILADVKTLG